MGTLKIKRVYEPAEPSDGMRVLVDRLWPRGLTKEAAQLAIWLKAIAPSNDLRKWFHQGAGTWDQFRLKYIHELKQNEAVGVLLEDMKKHDTITLLYAAHNTEQNHALVLMDFINQLNK